MPSVSPYLSRHHGLNWGLIAGLAFSVSVWGLTLDGVRVAAHVYATKGEQSFTRLMADKVVRKVVTIGGGRGLG